VHSHPPNKKYPEIKKFPSREFSSPLSAPVIQGWMGGKEIELTLHFFYTSLGLLLIG
jgi:hypothetical protein